MTIQEFMTQYPYAGYVAAGTIIFLVILNYILAWSFKIRKEIKEHRAIQVNQDEKEDELPNEEELKNMLADLEKPKIKTVKLVSTKKVKKETIKVGAEEIPQDEKDDVIKYINPVKRKSKLSMQYWKEWFLEKYFPGDIVLVNMELNNGFHREFMVKEDEDGFRFKGNKYLFDDDLKYYNIDAKLYQFDYHQSLVMPVKRKIPLSKIKKSIESSGLDIEYAINPSTLQRFMTAKLAEGVMKGTQLDEFMKKLQMFLVVTMIASLVHLALFVWGSGMLSNIKVPGLG